MKLKQEDRDCLKEFFLLKKVWMKENSLNVEENINLFKIDFIKYINEINQEENISFMVFILVLDQEIIECKKNKLIKNYKENVKVRASLKYYSAFTLSAPTTDNKIILGWIKESIIAYEVSRGSLTELEKSIRQKTKQSSLERQESSEQLKNTILR